MIVPIIQEGILSKISNGILTGTMVVVVEVDVELVVVVEVDVEEVVDVELVVVNLPPPPPPPPLGTVVVVVVVITVKFFEDNVEFQVELQDTL